MATDAHAGKPFTEAMAGVADEVTFGLAEVYRSAVEAGLGDCDLAPAISAEGQTTSSIVAFRAVARFLAVATTDRWKADDDAVRAMWVEAFQDATRSDCEELGPNG